MILSGPMQRCWRPSRVLSSLSWGRSATSKTLLAFCLRLNLSHMMRRAHSFLLRSIRKYRPSSSPPTLSTTTRMATIGATTLSPVLSSVTWFQTFTSMRIRAASSALVPRGATAHSHLFTWKWESRLSVSTVTIMRLMIVPSSVDLASLFGSQTRSKISELFKAFWVVSWRGLKGVSKEKVILWLMIKDEAILTRWNYNNGSKGAMHS